MRQIPTPISPQGGVPVAGSPQAMSPDPVATVGPAGACIPLAGLARPSAGARTQTATPHPCPSEDSDWAAAVAAAPPLVTQATVPLADPQVVEEVVEAPELMGQEPLAQVEQEETDLWRSWSYERTTDHYICPLRLGAGVPSGVG